MGIESDLSRLVDLTRLNRISLFNVTLIHYLCFGRRLKLLQKFEIEILQYDSDTKINSTV